MNKEGIGLMKKDWKLRPGWRPINIILMVLGFIIFWPLGLAMLAYNIWGNEMRAWFSDAKSSFEGGPKSSCARYRARSGNVAFDEFRENELKRLSEERRKLDEMRDDFDSYMRDLRRAKDQEEFDRYMSERESTKADKAKNVTPDTDGSTQPA